MKTVSDILRDPFTVLGDQLYRKIEGTGDVFRVYLNRTIVPGTNACETC
jgi:hypothetical protein